MTKRTTEQLNREEPKPHPPVTMALQPITAVCFDHYCDHCQRETCFIAEHDCDSGLLAGCTFCGGLLIVRFSRETMHDYPVCSPEKRHPPKIPPARATVKK